LKWLINVTTFLAREFGTLIVFYSVNHFYGTKTAIMASLIWAMVEVIVLRIHGQKMGSLFKYSLAMALTFGLVDLSLESPVLIKYESTITNMMTGIFFALTMRKDQKPIIQEFGEKRFSSKGQSLELTPERLFFFRVCTGFWAAYFIIKAIFYGWVARNYSIEESLVIRTTVGNITLYGLMFINIYFAKKIRIVLTKLRTFSEARYV
jgi:intracellular septation protein A